jgi:hypothetical protein
MALAMARPWKHPKTGIYWLRKRIPDDLCPLLGKREEKQSLGTRDPNEAKRVHAQALAELAERWANLRSGARALSGGSTRIAIIPAIRKSGSRSISASFGTITMARFTRICLLPSKTGAWTRTDTST